MHSNGTLPTPLMLPLDARCVYTLNLQNSPRSNEIKLLKAKQLSCYVKYFAFH